MLAAAHGYVDIGQLLGEKLGADVQQSDHEGLTALMLAAQQGQLNTVKLLVRRLNASVNQVSQLGLSALKTLHLALLPCASNWK